MYVYCSNFLCNDDFYNITPHLSNRNLENSVNYNVTQVSWLTFYGSHIMSHMIYTNLKYVYYNSLIFKGVGMDHYYKK